MYFFYLQLLIIPFADDRAKKIWNLPLCASEKEKYISGAADFGRQRSHARLEKMESLYIWFRSFVVIHYVNLPGGGGHLAGILPQNWPHSAGLGAPLWFTKKAVNQRLPHGKLLAGLWKLKS